MTRLRARSSCVYPKVYLYCDRGPQRSTSKVVTKRDYRLTVHDAVVETAEALIAGTLGPVDASRRLVGLAAELGALDDEDLLFFLELDSQTDHFPLGTAREGWSAAALEREDRVRERYETAVRDKALIHCRSLIGKYAANE